MFGLHGIALVVGISVVPFFCEDAKVLSKTAAGTKVAEIVKISADSVTFKDQEPVVSGRSVKMKTKENTYPIDEKAKVKWTKATKDIVPKVDEIAVGEKVVLHLTAVKTKDSDNKIDTHLVVTGIDLTPKPPKKDAPAKDSTAKSPPAKAKEEMKKDDKDSKEEKKDDKESKVEKN